METLEDICYKNLTNMLMSMPPYMQEMIFNRTIKAIEDHAIKTAFDTMPDIISRAMDDMATGNIVAEEKYIELYPNVNKNIIKNAINVAADSANCIAYNNSSKLFDSCCSHEPYDDDTDSNGMEIDYGDSDSD
jgi:hypothetical protein